MHRIASFAAVALLSSLPSFAVEPCRINVNTSNVSELELFARTGNVLAARIAVGQPYKTLEQLDAVKGVGASWLAANGPHVAFGGATTCTEKVKTPKPAAPKVAAPSPKL